MTDEITFTLKENPADELYELLKDIDVEKTPAFTISDTHGNSAEYVKVIRCKDCKHYEVAELNYDGTPDKRCKPSVCTNGQYAVERPEDWYCGDAEPKEKR